MMGVEENRNLMTIGIGDNSNYDVKHVCMLEIQELDLKNSLVRLVRTDLQQRMQWRISEVQTAKHCIPAGIDDQWQERQ